MEARPGRKAGEPWLSRQEDTFQAEADGWASPPLLPLLGAMKPPAHPPADGAARLPTLRRHQAGCRSCREGSGTTTIPPPCLCCSPVTHPTTHPTARARIMVLPPGNWAPCGQLVAFPCNASDGHPRATCACSAQLLRRRRLCRLSHLPNTLQDKPPLDPSAARGDRADVLPQPSVFRQRQRPTEGDGRLRTVRETIDTPQPTFLARPFLPRQFTQGMGASKLTAGAAH